MLSGVYTAIVTPFNDDGSVDYDGFKRLIDLQAEAGVAGIVPVGTTGESPTLNVEEHEKVIETTIEACRGKMQVIAGTGANSTEEAVILTKHAMEAGADATLQVTPYYNKPTQEGLYRHFSTIADLGLPVVLYNVPGRSACEIAVETVARLAKHPHVTAVKEAGGSVERVSAILDVCDITVLSGDDTLALPMMLCGAKGVISVASNIIPARVVKMIKAALHGNWAEAADDHRKLYRLFSAMFIDTNPIPIKTAMTMAGLLDENFRLPLCSPDPTVFEKIQTVLNEYGLVENTEE